MNNWRLPVWQQDFSRKIFSPIAKEGVRERLHNDAMPVFRTLYAWERGFKTPPQCLQPLDRHRR